MLKVTNYTRGNLITKKHVKFLNELIKTSVASSFADEFQDKRITKEHPKYYTLSTLLTQAIPNSEAEFTQYPLDDRRVKEIARSIFIEDNCLYSDPKIAFLDDKPYIIGGRHRIYAVAAVFAQLAQLNGDEAIDDEFNDLCEQEVRCEVVHVRNMETILEMLVADNQTRTIRASEATHLQAQLLGANSTSYNEPAKASLISSGLTASQKRDIAAQNFARRDYKRLTSETKWKIGRYIAQYVLYGTLDKISSKSTNRVENMEQFDSEMSKAWSILVELVEAETTITNFARSSRELALRVIRRMVGDDEELNDVDNDEVDDNTQDDSENVVTVEATPTRRRVGRPSKKDKVPHF